MTTLPRIGGDPVPAGTTLLVVGEGQVSTWVIGERELLIGRGDGCDVRIDHRALSRRHAAVRPGWPVTIQDLGSTNGTRVAGEVRRGGAPVELGRNDAFQIGPFSFLVMGHSAPQEHSLAGHDLLRVADPTADGVPPMVANLAKSRASVLILGDTGVGKEVLAETVHALSGRTGPLTRLNCAALSESLLESELFGHEKGAFTGATTARVGLLEGAEQGTVFLDEVGELPLSIQAKLLRAVERHEVLRVGSIRPVPIDVRFIAATNRDLPAEVEAGRFRRDLYFRLDGVTLAIPPLRDRRGMIGSLALSFLQQAGGPERPAWLSAPVLGALEAYDWPGNVRELKAVIERALLLARGHEIGVRHLAFAQRPVAEPMPRPGSGAAAAAPVPAASLPHVPSLAAALAAAAAGPDASLAFLDEEQRTDRARVVAALDACAGNQTRAAKELGIGRTTLLHRLRLYRIPRPRT